MNLRIVTPPGSTALAVSLERAKRHLNVDFDDDDDLLAAYIGAATMRVEQTARALTILPTTWELTLDGLCDAIVLPRAPVKSVTSVGYFDADREEQTLSADVYEVLTDPIGIGQIVLRSGQEWPALRGGDRDIAVRFIAGFDPVPPALQAAILLIVGGLYEQRADLTSRAVFEAPGAVEALVAPYRVWL